MRKDFVFIEATEERDAHWEYMEARIPRDVLDLFTVLMEHAGEIADLQESNDLVIGCILEITEDLYNTPTEGDGGNE